MTRKKVFCKSSPNYVKNRFKRKREEEESESEVGPIRRTSYKSSLMTLSNIFKTYKVSNAHKELLKQSPFWFMMEPFATNAISEDEVDRFKKNDMAIIKILQTYSIEDEAFHLGGCFLKLRRSDITLLFGIACGDKKISTSGFHKRPTDSKLASLFEPGHQLTYKLIISALSAVLKLEATDENNLSVAQLIILLIISSIFVPSSTLYLRWGVMKCVEEWDEINKYDWATFIKEDFISKLNKMKKGEEGVCKGFVPVVVYLLAEHTRGVFQPTLPEAFPRFLKWNFQELSRIVLNKKFSKLTPEMIETDVLTMSTVEANALNIKQTEHTPQKKNMEVHLEQGDQATIYNNRSKRKNDNIPKPELHVYARKTKIKQDPKIKQVQGLSADQGDHITSDDHEIEDTKIPEQDLQAEKNDQTTSESMAAYWKKQAELKDVAVLELASSLKGYRDGTITKLLTENVSFLNKKVTSLELEKEEHIEKIRTLSEEVESLKKKLKEHAPPLVLETPLVNKQFPESQESGSASPIIIKKHEPVGSYSMPTFSLNISQDEELRVEVASVPVKKLRLNIPKNYMLTEEETSKIQDLYDATGGDDITYWDNRDIRLMRSDFTPLLLNETSSDTLMDVWSYYITLDQPPDMPKIYVFQSCLWKYSLSFESGATKIVNDGLSAIENDGVRYAMFPMTTPGVGVAKLSEFSLAIHWTLFVYDTVEFVWYYYNSILPHNHSSNDLYYEEALLLAAFVHRLLQKSSLKSSRDLTTKKVLDCAQQSGSIECGFFVMMQMECIARGVKTKNTISKSELTAFKIRFLKRIINSNFFNDHKELLYLKELQTSFNKEDTTPGDAAVIEPAATAINVDKVVSDIVRAIVEENIDLSTPCDLK